MNKQKFFKYLAIFALTVLLFCIYTNVMDWKHKRHMASVTLRIVDDEGNIVPDADVFTHFVNYSRIQKDFRSKSDENGLYHAKGKTISHLFYRVSKDGYYTTKDRYSFVRRDQGKSRQRNKFFPCIVRWNPWNTTTTVILKKIKNPLALQARKIDMILPGLKDFYPFDLCVGDWVEPYGKGKKVNIYILLS